MAFASSWRLRIAIALTFPVLAIVVAPILEPAARTTAGIAVVLALAAVAVAVGLLRMLRS